jgi:fatty acid desaturase
METQRKFGILERFLFAVLLVALALAGFVYEWNKDTVEAAILIPMLLAYMLGCFFIYRRVLRLLANRFASGD